jgi:predicted PhzF superfamily epimerase YddE/YHI9
VQRFGLRWFTPTVEVALCGHGTLATAHALFVRAGNEHER